MDPCVQVRLVAMEAVVENFCVFTPIIPGDNEAQVSQIQDFFLSEAESQYFIT